MKTVFFSAVILTFLSVQIFAQDEGAAVARTRFERDKSIYISGGLSAPLGKNLGDYSNGLGFEFGFLKRLNKVLAIGPSITYSSYNYDKQKTYPFYYDEAYDEFYELYMEGGNVSLLGAGFMVKLNLIPIGDNTPFSIYGIGNPFVASVSRSAISASGTFYYWGGNGYVTEPFEIDSNDYEGFKKESGFTGGVNLGFGFEFAPSKAVSFFGQVTVSYTMPVNYISSQEYTERARKNGDFYYYPDNPDDIFYDAEVTIYDEEYPIVKKGFPGLNFRFGLSFNF